MAAWDQGNLKVLSTGEPDLKWRRVTAKFERQAPGVMHMTVRSGDVRETITVTPNHPYLRPSDVIGKGVLELVKMDPGGDWTAVLKLKPGDELVSALGGRLVVDSIDVDDTPTRVYSLEVEGLHSFAVGELAAWVHNHGNSKTSKKEACLYRLYDKKTRKFLKWGITDNIRLRYPPDFVTLKPYICGCRDMILDLEREKVEESPGPMNFEPWAGSSLK